ARREVVIKSGCGALAHPGEQPREKAAPLAQLGQLARDVLARRTLPAGEALRGVEDRLRAEEPGEERHAAGGELRRARRCRHVLGSDALGVASVRLRRRSETLT